MRRVLPLLVLLTLAFAPPPPPKQRHDAAAADLKAMQGEWKPVYVENRGRKHQGDTIGRATALRIERSRWEGFMAVDEVALDPKQDPKAIDGKPTKEARGRRLHGIYKMQGDTLTVCWSEGKRPVSFTEVKGNDVLIRFERKKP